MSVDSNCLKIKVTNCNSKRQLKQEADHPPGAYRMTGTPTKPDHRRVTFPHKLVTRPSLDPHHTITRPSPPLGVIINIYLCPPCVNCPSLYHHPVFKLSRHPPLTKIPGQQTGASPNLRAGLSGILTLFPINFGEYFAPRLTTDVILLHRYKNNLLCPYE